MALEAWAHRRVEEGDPVDQVVAQIVGDPAMSSAVLLVAVDVVLSHGAQSIEAAVPLVACPELLCMDRLRPHHDNMRFPDFFGLEALQQEPITRCSGDFNLLESPIFPQRSEDLTKCLLKREGRRFRRIGHASIFRIDATA
jgi:hypothetical protein